MSLNRSHPERIAMQAIKTILLFVVVFALLTGVSPAKREPPK